MARPAHYLEAGIDRAVPPAFVSLVVATVAVLVAGLVSVVALTTSINNSPGDAVSALLSAASSGNVTGMLDAVDPVERAAIAPALDATVADLEKLGILAPGTNLSAIPGVGVTFTGVTTETESLGDRSDLAAVVFTGGTALAHVDPSLLPLGTVVKGLMGSVTGNATGTVPDVPVPLAGPHAEDHPIATIQRDGQWYVSIGYTVAEVARRAAGLALPSPASALPAVGESTAEGVARTLVAAATAGDITRLIELTDPQESAPLHDYGSLIIQSAGHVPAPPVTVTSLDLATSPVDGGTLVTVTDFSASVGHGDTVALTPDGCLRFSSPTTTTQQVCQPAGTNLLAGYGVVAVERNGTFYLDPYRTVLDDVEHLVAGLNLGTIGALLKGGTPGGLLGVVSGLLRPATTQSTSSSAPSPLGG